VRLQDFAVQVQQWGSGSTIVEAQSKLDVYILDPRSLLMRPFLSITAANISMKELTSPSGQGRCRSSMDVSGSLATVGVCINEHALALLHRSISSWKHAFGATAHRQRHFSIDSDHCGIDSTADDFISTSTPGCGAYILENKTQLHLRVGQEGTREVVELSADSTMSYSWLQPPSEALRLRFSGAEETGGWSPDVPIDGEGQTRINIDVCGVTTGVIVHVSRFRGVHMLVQIYGALQIRSTLDTPLDISVSNTSDRRTQFNFGPVNVPYCDSTTVAVPNYILSGMELTVSRRADPANDAKKPVPASPPLTESGATRTVRIELPTGPNAASVQLLSLPALEVQFCCTVQREHHGAVEVSRPFMLVERVRL
jgi:hypothetical protein